MTRPATMRVAKGACIMCGGDVYLDYKANRPGGPYPKCVQGSHYGKGIVSDSTKN